MLTAVAQVTIGVWFDVTGTYHWAVVAIFASLISAAALIAAAKAPEKASRQVTYLLQVCGR